MTKCSLLFLFASLASAGSFTEFPDSFGTISQFTAIASIDSAMSIAGTDGQGNALTVNTSALLTFFSCDCRAGQLIQFPGFGPTGFATVNGVGYGGLTYLGQNEGGNALISGVFPSIDEPVGWKGTVTFPITYSMYIVFYQNDAANHSVVPMFGMKGDGTGTASAIMTVIDSPGGPFWSGGYFTLTSDVSGLSAASISDAPEASTGWLLAFGIAFLAALKSKKGSKALARLPLVGS